MWAANIVDKGYAAMLNELARDVGVTLDLRPKVSDQELLELLRTAGLFLCAPRLEPFGLAPLEASACGLARPSGAAQAGTRESIIEGQNGFLTAPDEASFAHKIDEALADKGRLQEMGRQAREIVEQKWCTAARGGRVWRSSWHAWPHRKCTSTHARSDPRSPLMSRDSSGRSCWLLAGLCYAAPGVLLGCAATCGLKSAASTGLSLKRPRMVVRCQTAHGTRRAKDAMPVMAWRRSVPRTARRRESCIYPYTNLLASLRGKPFTTVSMEFRRISCHLNVEGNVAELSECACLTTASGQATNR